MSFSVRCPHCDRVLNASERLAGKAVRCPGCRRPLQLPGQAESAPSQPAGGQQSAAAPSQRTTTLKATNPGGAKRSAARSRGVRTPASASSAVIPIEDEGSGTGSRAVRPLDSLAGAEGWWVRSPEQQSFGPATKAELDQWVAENRIDAGFELRPEGESAWRPAVEVYPQLARSRPAAAASPAAATTPVAAAAPVAAAPAAESEPSNPFAIRVDTGAGRSGGVSSTLQTYQSRKRRSRGKEASWIVSIALALGMIALIVALRFWQKGGHSDEVREAAYEVFTELFSEVANPKTVRRLVDKYHDDCFAANYTMGGRRRAAKFDEEGYFKTMEMRIAGELMLQTVREQIDSGPARPSHSYSP